MERVGKYYGVRLKDAIKFAWLDATFAVERKMDKRHRNRVQRTASGTNVTVEANAFDSCEAATTITTENGMQETLAPTDESPKESLGVSLNTKIC